MIGNHSCNNNQDSLLDHALAYSRRGWSITSVSGKIAIGRWKPYQTERPSEATLRQLFAKGNVTGLAVILGSVSGDLACRDFDDQASYDRWASTHPDLAGSLPTVATHRGRHVYFRGPEGFVKFRDGEYRATCRQYCVLPPSRHPAGTAYRWLVPLPDGELPFVDPFDSDLCNRVDRAGAVDGVHTANGADAVDIAGRASAAGTEHTANGVDIANPANAAHTATTDQLPEFHAFSLSTMLQDVEKAIAATLPTAPGQRYHCVFRFARHLKAIHALRDSPPAELRTIVEQWHGRALPFISTKPFLETWADFVQAWKRVKFAIGEGAIDTAFERARVHPPVPAVAKLYGDSPIVLLASLCRELQEIAGDGEFYLDCRTAGRLIGVDHTTAWRYLEVLCADGILVAGEKGSRSSGKASRFRYIEH